MGVKREKGVKESAVKFGNVDVIACLERIMKENTAFYQSDFEVDKEIIRKAAISANKDDHTLLWMSRSCGTQCYLEREVFILDSGPHNAWLYYIDEMSHSSDRFLGYVVEVSAIDHGKIFGNLYQLDLIKHGERVKKKSVKADMRKLVYEHGERMITAGEYFSPDLDPYNLQFGRLNHSELVPNDPALLRDLLRDERYQRSKMCQDDFEKHLVKLHNDLLHNEAQRIISSMEKLSHPNSADNAHYLVELSMTFIQLASAEDINRLPNILPYRTLSIFKVDDWHEVCAVIDKSEKLELD